MSFLYKDIFILLIVLVVPILIHLISSFNRKKVNIPEIFLFENEIVKINRVSRIKELLLLLLRILVILSVLFILAKPYFAWSDKNVDGKSDGGGEKDKLYLIVIDDTLSSSYLYPTTPLLEKLKLDATEFIENVCFEATFGLIHFNKHDSTPFYTKSKEDILLRINLVQIDEDYEIDVSDRMKNIVDSLKRFDDYEKSIGIFSDFQENDWAKVKIETDANVFVKNFSKKLFSNYSISDIYSPDIISYAGQPHELYFTINNYSDKASEVRVSIRNNSNEIKSEHISIKGNGEVKHKTQVRMYKEGKNDVTIHLEPDKYKYDNTGEISIHSVKTYNVIILIPEQEKILKRALNNSIGTISQRNYGLIRIDNEIDSKKTYDIIICYELSRLEGQQRQFVSNNLDKSTVLVFYSKNDDTFILDRFLQDMFGKNIKLRDLKNVVNRKKDDDISSDLLKEVNINNNKVYFKSFIGTDIDTDKLRAHLKIDGDKLLISYQNDLAHIFFAGDISIEESNFIVTQMFPVMMNKIAYLSVKQKGTDRFGNLGKSNNAGVREHYDKWRFDQGVTRYLSEDAIRKLLPDARQLIVYKNIEELNDLISHDQNLEEDHTSRDINTEILIIVALLLFFIIFNIENAYAYIRKA